VSAAAPSDADPAPAPSQGQEGDPSTGLHRYAVGIDLGTTHCVVAYRELGEEPTAEPIPGAIMPIPQLTAPGVLEERSQLPSFLYQAHASELAPGDLALPWEAPADTAASIVGSLARELGGKTPIRLVASAKSWLCHGGIDRHQALLPLEGPQEVPKVSPVEATYRYLSHLRRAWDHRFPDAPLEQQDVTVTVPASFDPAARELTAEAAEQAGLGQASRLTLLEEPQAALYRWIEASGEDWREQLGVGDIVLVVDIGGGTTDLSLVAVGEQDGNLVLERIAVGDHILLGGDNMDLALAYRVKAKLEQQGKTLQPWQVNAIVHGCRDAKEALLGEGEADDIPITVPSRGSRLLGGTLRTELTRDEVREGLVEGFFPRVGIDEHPRQQARGALREKGLPYARDAAVTRHLAWFLSRQHGAAERLLGASADRGDFIRPSAVLLNGGVLKAPDLARRLMEIVNGWLAQAGAESAKLLEGADLDLAVAGGAAYYAQVRRGRGVRIRGGLASGYYVGIESAMPAIPGIEPPLQALCVAPFGMEEGSEVQVPSREFGLVVGEPVRFRFFGSTIRRDDPPGTLLESWAEDELEELPEIQAELPVGARNSGEVVPVHLASRVTELGTLRLEAIPLEGDERWQVELEVREGR
jgi:molecular chaperone DnaK (HSP70)